MTNLINNIVIVLVYAKCSKIITEENITSVQQLPLHFPLFFTFLSEVLTSGLKTYFDGDVFQDEVIMLYLCVVFFLHREFAERIS